MTFVVGLTGGIGSGKSTVAGWFSELGAEVIDTDDIARDLTRGGKPAVDDIARRFGNAVVASDGSLDRARMRKLAFSDERARRDLEEILHPLIRREVMRRLAAAQGPYVILVVPLLAEAGAYDFVNRVLVIDCNEEAQIDRVMSRNQLSRDDVMAIVAAQASRAKRLEKADDVLVNEGALEELRSKVEALHRTYMELAT